MWVGPQESKQPSHLPIRRDAAVDEPKISDRVERSRAEMRRGHEYCRDQSNHRRRCLRGRLGLSRQHFYKPRLNLDVLGVRQISQASVEQRAGRAGRGTAAVTVCTAQRVTALWLSQPSLPFVACRSTLVLLAAGFLWPFATRILTLSGRPWTPPPPPSPTPSLPLPPLPLPHRIWALSWRKFGPSGTLRDEVRIFRGELDTARCRCAAPPVAPMVDSHI